MKVEKYRYVYFVIIFTIYALVIFSNSTIVYLIVIHQSLHEPMYIFIAALLINSIFCSTTIYPKLLFDVLSEKQIISHTMCHFQYFLFYTSGGSQFLLLAAMAYDRYVSICKPLKYPVIMKKTTISVFLVLAWLVPACQVAGSSSLSATRRIFTLKGNFCSNSLNKLLCVTSNELSIYGVIVLLNLGLLPMLFILFTYTKIIIIAFQSCGDVRRKAVQTCLPHLLVLMNCSVLITYDVVIVKLESDFPKTARFVMTLQIITYNPLCNPIIYGLKMKEISKHLKSKKGNWNIL
uniref:G-protein coupled receptors family 1 profile domain-containing protein n=1 Tax=Oreochromis aureus TaxID=47969 RepID=A0A668UH66_OREAU